MASDHQTRAYDMGRRLDEAAAFMEQGKAVFVPVLLLSAKAEITRLRAVVLRMVRESNDCAEPCRTAREHGRCGCIEEADGEISRG